MPEFIENLITVYPVSIIYYGYAIYSHTSIISIDLAVYPEIKDPENTVIYYRKYKGEGLFLPLPTTYDDLNNKLVTTVTGFGEIVFGVPDNSTVSKIPILYEPMDDKEFLMDNSVTLRWTGKGFYNSFKVQVSADTLFSSILQESITSLSNYTATDLERDIKYFWRVNSVLGTQTSDWSPVWRFSITDTTTSIGVLNDIGTSKDVLAQNYPNPFNSITKISYHLIKPMFVTLKVYDHTGREVETLVSQEMGQGIFSIDFDARELPGGLYYYSLVIGERLIETKRMLLIRE